MSSDFLLFPQIFFVGVTVTPILLATMPGFPDRLRDLMTRTGVNQVELSRRSGITQSNISQYLKGTVEPTLQSLLALSRGLRCTLEDITGLPALKDAEAAIDKLTPEAVEFGKFFESLSDGDPRKDILKKLMQIKSESHDPREEPGTETK